jgi:hypothetical protein
MNGATYLNGNRRGTVFQFGDAHGGGPVGRPSRARILQTLCQLRGEPGIA